MSAEVPTAIVDASVAIKFVVEEEDSDRALTLGLRYSIIVPAIFWAECANILFKKVKEREIAAAAAPFAWAGLRQFRIATAAPTPDMDDATFDLSMRLRHPAYDCAYLALARERQAPFYTADKRLLGLLGRVTVPGVDAYALTTVQAVPH